MKTGVRRILLLVVLLLAGAVYFYQDRRFGAVDSHRLSNESADRSASLPLDEETKAKIRHYFDGIEVEAKENNLSYLYKLDYSVGRPQLSEGKYRAAYRTYQKVLAISYQQGSLMGIGTALTMLAHISEYAGETGEGIFTALLAYKIAQTMKNKEEMGVVELSLARILRKEDLSLSMSWLLQAKESLQGSRYKEDYVRLLVDLADALRSSGQGKKASGIYEEAWELAESLGDSPDHKWAKNEAGLAYGDDLRRARQYEKATVVLERTQSHFSESEKTTRVYGGILHALARIYSAEKKNAEAGRYYLSAHTNYELARLGLPGEEARVRVDNDYKGLVDDLVMHHLASGDYAAAVAVLESNKARTLNDIIEDPSYKEVHQQWEEMERRHAKELMAWLENEDRESLPRQEEAGVLQLAGLLNKQRDERRSLQANLQLKEITATGGLSKEHLEEIQRQFPSDVAVLSFFMGGRQGSVFLLTRGRIRHFPLPLDVAEYLRAAEELRVALTNPYNDFYREPAQMLFQEALEPVIEALPSRTKILVYSPDGIFSRIPLEVLMDGERFLGERYGVYRIASLRYVTAIAGVKAPAVQNGIACVDPDVYRARLPFQRETGEVLDELYGSRMTSLVGKECSENKLVTAIQKGTGPTFLHMGAHGNFYPGNAMDSTIWLSAENGSREGQAWNGKAMARVDMSDVDLITLSSCETGLTDPRVRRDVFGIARALFFAGAKRVVAPLWAVNDQATAKLMQVFYQAYSENIPAVLSLQRAQKALMETERYRHPYYWSAFVLMGAVQ